MSHAITMPSAAMSQAADRRASALGWGISLLAHVLAVAWVWHAWPAHRTDADTTPVTRIEVRLVPVTPKPPSAPPAPAPQSAVPRVTTRPPHVAPAPALREPPAIVVPAPPSITYSAPAAEVPTGASAPAPTTPTVDLAAARAAARRIAREDASGLVALPERKPVVDPNADHHVEDPLERARRPDCQTARANSTNLLANVVMLAADMVANAVDDSGCKW